MSSAHRLFIILSIIIATLVGVFILINYRSADQALHETLNQVCEHVQGAFDLALSATETRMVQIATYASSSREVQQIFLEGKKAVEAEGGGPGGKRAAAARSALLDIVGPGRDELSRKFDFRQLHFHLGPGSTTFLRAHKPEKFGDNMDSVRHTIVAANQSKQNTAGFESGRIYSGIRGVVPVFAKDPRTGEQVHVGALEAGTSFQITLADVAKKQHVNLAVLLTEEHLRSVMFPEILTRHFQQISPIDGFVLEATTDPLISTLLEEGMVGRLWKAPGSMLTELDDNPLSISGFPLLDFLGRLDRERLPVGIVIAWRDASHEVAVFEQALRTNLIYALVGFLIVEFLLYYGIKVTSGRLETMVQQGRRELQEINMHLLQEIEERKQAQQALAQERRLFVTGPTVVFRWQAGEHWPAVYVSPNVEEQFGYAPDDLLSGRIKFTELIHPDDLERVVDEVKSYNRQGVRNFEHEYRIVDSQGENRWIYDQTVIERNDDGEITHYHGYMLDITKRRETEDTLRHYRDQLQEMILERTAELQKNETRFRALLDHSPDTIVELSTNTRILYNNKAAQQLMPGSIGRICHEVFAGRDTACKGCPIIKAMKSGKVETATIQAVLPGSDQGVRFWNVTGVPMKDEQGKLTGVLKLARDITERRGAEQQIREALHEKEILLREIHHRVKNNMQVISSLLKLNARFINNEQALLAFAESRNRIKAMALIHETLYQSGNMAAIDLQEYVRQLVRNLIRVYDVHHDRIQVRIDTGEVALSLEDATPVGLIINELLSNAFKYAFPGDREGEIVLSIRETADENIELTIHDNGVGMPRGMDIHQVTGSMGVQLVLGLVERQLGGTISVKSDRGTTVSIVFCKKT